MPKIRNVARIAKLKKTGRTLHQSAKHNLRLQDTPNANPKLSHYNQILIGSETPRADWSAYVEAEGVKLSSRKDRVDALECVLSASPEYFNSPEALALWRDAMTRYLAQREDCFFAVLHLDEHTPHIHAYLFPPRSPKTGQFNGGQVNREWLTDFQDQTAEAVAHLGIERGIRGSKAKHTNLKQFYQQVERGQQQAAEAVNLPEPRKVVALDSKNQPREITVQTRRELTALGDRLRDANTTIREQEIRLDELHQVNALAAESGVAGAVSRVAELERENRRLREEYEALNAEIVEDVLANLDVPKINTKQPQAALPRR